MIQPRVFVTGLHIHLKLIIIFISQVVYNTRGRIVLNIQSLALRARDCIIQYNTAARVVNITYKQGLIVFVLSIYLGERGCMIFNCNTPENIFGRYVKGNARIGVKSIYQYNRFAT